MTATLVAKKPLAKDVTEYSFSYKGLMTVRPGQYILLHIGDSWRPFSVVDMPNENSIKVVVKYIKGLRASNYLKLLEVGDRITLQQPQGGLGLSQQDDVVFIATSTGIVPCVEVAKHNLENGFRRDMYIIFGASTEDDLFYRDELQDLDEKYENCKVVITLSRAHAGWNSYKGRTINFVEDNFASLKDANFYVCGRKEIVAVIIERLDELGVPADHRHLME